MKSQIKIAIRMILIMAIITGIAYPVFITGIAQLFFHHKANGSLINKDGSIIGSELIGQAFDSSIYFSPRPSAVDYNPLPSGGSNLGVTSEKLKKNIELRKIIFLVENGLSDSINVPVEMLFASASGLDPHISPESAKLQIDKVAMARNFNGQQKQKLEQVVKYLTEEPQYLCLGNKRINVLLLNLEVDKIKEKRK